jgi:hypothetical protein
MNATQVQTGYEPVHQEAAITERTIAGGALMESIGAVATMALAIVALAGAFSSILAAIATIVLGASIWIEGGAFAVSHKAEFAGKSAYVRTLEWTESLGAEFLGGLCGIVLGILALLGVVPMTLLSIAVLVLGATFLFSNTRTWSASSSQPMFGLASLILGLLAVCGINPLTLVLVGLICLGASTLLNGAAMGARMALALNK